MMSATLLLVFLLTDLSGSKEVHRISQISVQKEQTIIIPCLYDPVFVNSSKYLSYGSYLPLSHNVQHERISVLDYRTEHFFIVILRNAEVGDTGNYWCGINIPGSDRGTKLYLKVTEGNPKLKVSSQNVTGYEGESITIHCHGASKWCKIGRSCESKGTLNKVIISGDDEVLNVTLKEPQKEDTGWYFCFDGESQMPVYISVKTALRSETSSVHKHFVWLVILGVMMAVIICGFLVLLYFKRKQKAEASDLYECMNREPQVSQKNNHGLAREDTYENMTGVKCNIEIMEETGVQYLKETHSNTGIFLL